MIATRRWDYGKQRSFPSNLDAEAIVEDYVSQTGKDLCIFCLHPQPFAVSCRSRSRSRSRSSSICSSAAGEQPEEDEIASKAGDGTACNKCIDEFSQVCFMPVQVIKPRVGETREFASRWP